MKREARNHSKTKRLCRKLDIPLYQAVGILECLWHVAAVEAWRGDIGKLSNEDIALALDFRGDEDKLIDALVSCGWLDESGEHRLLVHDWPEHADAAVQKRAKRAKESGQIGFWEDMALRVQTNTANGGLRTHAGPVPVPEPVPEPVPTRETYDFDADPLANIPDGLAPLQYAGFVIEQADLPTSTNRTRKFGEAIGLLAKAEHVALPEATRRMLDRVKIAQGEGENEWDLWLHNSRWKAQPRASPAALGINPDYPPERDDRPPWEQLGTEWCARTLLKHNEGKRGLTDLEAQYIRSLKLVTK